MLLILPRAHVVVLDDGIFLDDGSLCLAASLLHDGVGHVAELSALPLDADEDLPGLAVVDEDEDEAGEGADQGHHQRHDRNRTGRS